MCNVREWANHVDLVITITLASNERSGDLLVLEYLVQSDLGSFTSLGSGRSVQQCKHL